MTNKGLLTVIVVLLAGIFGAAVVEMNQNQTDGRLANNLGKIFKEIGVRTE